MLLRQAVGAGAPRRLAQGMAKPRWPPSAPGWTAQAAADALNDRLARLELQDVQLRMLDARIVPVAKGPALAKSLHVVSGDAKLVPTADGVRVDYRFGSASADPVVITCDVWLPQPLMPADLHKAIVALRCDNSWHRVTAAVELITSRYESTRSTPLAQNRPTSISFQPPSFDDQDHARAHLGAAALRRQARDAAGLGL